MKVEKLLKRKSFKDLVVTDNQKHQLQCVLDWLDNQDVYKIDSIVTVIPKMVESGVEDLYVRRLI